MPTVEPARPAEHADAFRLLFRHLTPAERELRVGNARELLARGELEPGGVLVARAAAGVVGVMVCQALPGAGGVVWPPQVADGLPDPAAVEDALVRRATDLLRDRGTKLAQCLLAPSDARLAGPLVRGGFPRITRLLYLRHELELPPDLLCAPTRYEFRPYRADDALFHATLLRTYEETLDCPEINGVRTLEEILVSHQTGGDFDPDHWWLATDRGRAVGVVLTNAIPDWDGWEVAYLGVPPEQRRRGAGRELVRQALVEAKAAGVHQVTLTVDERNTPARALYRRAGFVPFDEREVFLAMWNLK